MSVYVILAEFITGFSYLLLNLYLIQYKGMSHRMVFALSAIFIVLLWSITNATGLIELNAVLLLLFLLGIGFLQKRLGLVQKLYFAMFSMVIVTFAKLMLINIGMQLWILSPFNIYVSTIGLLHFLAVTVILLAIVFARKKIQQFAEFILDSPLYYFSYFLLILGLVFAFIFSVPASKWLSTFQIQFAQIGSTVASIVVLVMLLLILLSSHITKKRLLEEQQVRLDKELLDYVKKLEVLHDELATFRHDYINLLLALDEGVRTRNIDLVERVYYEVIQPTSTIINDQELEIVKLSHIVVPEVKSILSVKLLEAHQQQVKVTVDIPYRIEEIAMPLVPFIRSISILMDNAIEEAVQSREKILEVAFFEVEKCQYFVVRNSCSQQQIDLLRIFEKGESKKANHRGYGLFSLKRLIYALPNVAMETSFQAPYFTQTLLMKKGLKMTE